MRASSHLPYGLFGLFALLAAANSLQAQSLKLAPIFGDNMVLQRDRNVVVWGEADPGEKVEVKIAAQHLTTVADGKRQWRVSLAPMPAGGPHTLTVSSGGPGRTVTDILVGDVWLCSGQSNMQMSLKDCDDGKAVAAEAGKYPKLRLGTVKPAWTNEPQKSAEITWKPASPETAREFSAVAYYFAHELLKDPALADVPIGMVNCSLGGTAAEAWISKEALADFKPEDLRDSLFGIKPTTLYNGMIAPLGPASFAGVIWYQGESNAGRPETYPRLMTALITEWRKQFDSPELPFIIVQLPEFKAEGLSWAWIREAQAKVAESVPNVLLAVTLGTTDGFDLHPKEKHEIGRRASLLARRHVYKRDIVARGPVFKDAKEDGSKMRVTFDTAGDGLASSDPREIRGFAVAGEDGLYRYANATLADGDAVVLECDQVPQPKTVRYAWASIPDATLTNKPGLPAAPFRTDNQPPAGVELQKQQVARRVATSAYEVTISGEGRITSLGAGGKQFLSNALSGAGGTSIPGFFGPRVLPNIREIGPDLLSCSDSEVTLLLAFREKEMEWKISNRGKGDINFHIALLPQVQVTGGGDGAPAKLTHGKAPLLVSGINSIADSPEGKVLHTNIGAGESKSLMISVGATK